MNRVACTIVSINYLHFGWTLAQSFLQHHPTDKFYILLVDRIPSSLVSPDERITLIGVEDLGIKDFNSIAFKYNILELNTCVKPSFLLNLLSLGAQKIIYFDPDIYIYHPLELIFEALENFSIVLTPHLLTPTQDEDHIYEKDLLITGVFNLGFIAVSGTAQTTSFLKWWEERCLTAGFHDLRSGLFVDQKWIDFVPCFFADFYIIRHPGCNVAYWNLPERTISNENDVWSVNGSPLIFFHFSGFDQKHPDQVSSKMRVSLQIYDDLKKLLLLYGEKLQSNEADKYAAYTYSYSTFSTGERITTLARRIYSATIDTWSGNPFDSSGDFYRAFTARGLLSKHDESGKFSSINLPANDNRLQILNKILFSLPKIIGGNRYTMLMKYLSHISILRNQRQLLIQKGLESHITE